MKIGAKVVRHGRYITFQLAEVAIPRSPFANILRLIDGRRAAPLPPRRRLIPSHPAHTIGQPCAAKTGVRPQRTEWSAGRRFDRKIGLIRGKTRPTAPVHDGKCGANALRATIVGYWRGSSG